MKFHGAKMRENGISFGLIVVHESVLQNDQEYARMLGYGKNVFGPISIILMAYDKSGELIYKGRRDIVKFLPQIDLRRIAWVEYSV